MRRSRKLIFIAAAIVLSLAVFLFACGTADEPQDREYSHKDLSAYTSEELELSADYGAFYRPSEGALSAVVPYSEEGVYYLFYTKKDDPLYKVYSAVTPDLVSYTERGEVFSASGIAGETEISVSCVTEYAGDRYMFYTASRDGKNKTVRVAVSDNTLSTFTRKGDFIMRAEDYGFEGGIYDPYVIYDSGIDKFIAVASTYNEGRAVLAMFYIDTTLGDESAELICIAHTDRYGFEELNAPSLFTLGGTHYLTYFAKDGKGSGVMYCLTGAETAGEYVECGAPLDSAAYTYGRVVTGAQTVMVGCMLGRKDNAGSSYTGSANIAAHALTVTKNGELALSYPQGYVKRFALDVPTVGSSTVKAGATPVKVAKEVQQYRLSAELKLDADTSEFGFIFGHTGADVKVSVQPALGKIKAGCGNDVSAVGYIDIECGKTYKVDIFAEGSAYVMYIDGTAFSFRACNTGNKDIAVYAAGGVELKNITMLAADNIAVDDGSEMLTAGSSKKLTLTAQNDSYMLGVATLHTEAEVTVEIACGETVKSSTGKGFIDFYEYLPVGKGDTVTVTVTANAAGLISGNMYLTERFRVPRRPVPTELRQSSGRGAAVTVREDGSYRFDAMTVQENYTDGTLLVEKNGKLLNSLRLNEGYGYAYGTVTAKKGDIITASVYFDADVTDYTVRLALYAGGTTEDNLIVDGDTVADKNGYDLGVEIDDDRNDEADISTSFGPQGYEGFVYTYGKAADELIKLPVYNGTSHTAEVTDKVAVTATTVKAGGGYLAGITYVAANACDRVFTLGITPAAGAEIIVMAYQNRVCLAEQKVTEEGSAEFELTLEPGDRIIFAVGDAKGGDIEAGYSIKIAKPVIKEKLNASLIDEFYTDIADANAWSYGYSHGYDFDTNSFEFVRFTAYNGGGAWVDPAIGSLELKQGWLLSENQKANDVAAGYTFDRSGRFRVGITFTGSNDDETRMCARVIVGNDGTNGAEFIGDGSQSASWSASREVIANAGDTVYVIFFREGGKGYYHGSFNITIKEI